LLLSSNHFIYVARVAETAIETVQEPAKSCLPAGDANRLTIRGILLWVGLAFVSFVLANLRPEGAYLIVLYLFALCQLARADTWRKAAYPSFLVGWLLGAVGLGFFWQIFSAGAAALWCVLAFWVSLFVVLARLCLRKIPKPWGWVALPFIWCGLEYFRSELYYLKFSWFTAGFTFGAATHQAPFASLGVYGVGFVLMAAAAAAAFVWQSSKGRAIALLLVGAGVVRLAGMLDSSAGGAASPNQQVKVAGIQLEFPTEQQVLAGLDKLATREPDAQILVLSEYTFAEPIPEKVKAWCRKRGRYLIVGGKDPAGANFYNTAFVISPDGDIALSQVKSVPIQFFKDGLPAREQKVWNSPWGKIGLCICYDLSYARVTDGLARLGAQALIVPTMDVADWGRQQHELHARIAPMRAAEYGIPIFRLASSGISQVVDATGKVLAAAPFPGEEEMLSTTLNLRHPARLPLDRWLASACTVLTGLAILYFIVKSLKPTQLSGPPQISTA
jgi:apolipoprotein N-acyltransferase